MIGNTVYQKYITIVDKANILATVYGGIIYTTIYVDKIINKQNDYTLMSKTNTWLVVTMFQSL